MGMPTWRPDEGRDEGGAGGIMYEGRDVGRDVGRGVWAE